MNKITIKKLAFTTTLTLIIAGALVALNIASSYFFTRLDLTQEKSFTLSEASKGIVKNLKDKIEVRAYFSKQLAPDLSQQAQYAKDLLNEYAALNSKFAISYIDPSGDDKKMKEAQDVNIPQLEFQVLEKDQFKVQKGYLGIAFIKGDKKEAIPVLKSTDNLEYEITSIINRLTTEQLAKVGFITGHGEAGITQIPPEIMAQLGNQAGLGNNDFSLFADGLRKNYDPTSVNLKDPKSLDGVAAVIVGQPTKDYDQDELYNLDQFIMRGGKVLFLVPAVSVDISKGLQAEPANKNLIEFIKNYGIQVNTDLVVDKTNETVAFNAGQTSYYLPYPFWPKLTDRSFNNDHPATRTLQSATLPFISSLTAAGTDGIKTSVLASSSSVSTTQAPPFNIMPNQQISFAGAGNRPLIMEADGHFSSYFKNRDLPKLEAGKASASPVGFLPESTVDGTVIVLANSAFVTNDYLQRFSANFTLAQNLVDYLASDSGLISIRAKTPSERPIQTPSDSTALTIKGINIIGIPLLVLALGMIHYWRRIRN